jgi:hypothetical protein
MEQEIRGELMEYLPQDLVNYIIVPYIIWTDEMNEDARIALWFTDPYRRARGVIGLMNRYHSWSMCQYDSDRVRNMRKAYFQHICPRCRRNPSSSVHLQCCIVCNRAICDDCIKKNSNKYCGCTDKEIADMKVTKSNKRHSRFNFVDMN